MDGFQRFDATDYLDNEETIAEYLTAALEDETPDVFLAALSDVAKAVSYTHLDVYKRQAPCCCPAAWRPTPLRRLERAI